MDETKKYFDPKVTDRERAIFEGGIALGTIYHQFVGVPIAPDKHTVRVLEEAMEKTIKLQPFKTDVKVKIDIKRLQKKVKRRLYGYETLKGEYLNVRVKTTYGKAKAILRMRYIPKLNYTLMYIEKVSP